MLTEVREEIEQARQLAAARGEEDVVRHLDHALAAVAPERLLTTSQAAEYLGIHSVNTVKALVRAEGLRTEMHGNRLMIPVRELERLEASKKLAAIRASDRSHDEADAAFGSEGLTEDEMAGLTAGRPGRLPWQPQPALTEQ